MTIGSVGDELPGIGGRDGRDAGLQTTSARFGGLDGRSRRLAKVRVADSNPVVRSSVMCRVLLGRRPFRECTERRLGVTQHRGDATCSWYSLRTRKPDRRDLPLGLNLLDAFPCNDRDKCRWSTATSALITRP